MRSFLLMLLLVTLFSGIAWAHEPYYATLDGRISLAGSEPLIKVLIQVGEEGLYTLSGPLSRELQSLSRFRVLVTGKISGALYPGTLGDMEVETYSLLDPYYGKERHWVLGSLRRCQEDLVLVGDDQVIYTLLNASVVGGFDGVNKRVLLVGVVEFTGNYAALLQVETFKFLLND